MLKRVADEGWWWWYDGQTRIEEDKYECNRMNFDHMEIVIWLVWISSVCSSFGSQFQTTKLHWQFQFKRRFHFKNYRLRFCLQIKIILQFDFYNSKRWNYTVEFSFGGFKSILILTLIFLFALVIQFIPFIA